MCRIYGYERISTKEERRKQTFTRQDSALARYTAETGSDFLLIFRDDASGKNFDRENWKKLEELLQPGDTVVFKDICRFTREYDNGFAKYMQLLEKGVELVFLDNPTVSTEYIKNMMDVAERQKNRIAKKSLKDTIELLILVELDRAEQERLTTVKRIKDGIAASEKKSGRKPGQLDKMTTELAIDLKAYMNDRSVKAVDIMKKHNISRNTLKKYVELLKTEE